MAKISSVAEYRRLEEEGYRIPMEDKRFHEIADLTYDYENEVFLRRYGRPIDRDNLSDIDLLGSIICELTGLKDYGVSREERDERPDGCP